MRAVDGSDRQPPTRSDVLSLTVAAELLGLPRRPSLTSLGAEKPGLSTGRTIRTRSWLRGSRPRRPLRPDGVDRVLQGLPGTVAALVDLEHV